MSHAATVYAVETPKSVADFVQDFIAAAKARNFVINNPSTMDMQQTLRAHGGEVSEDFDLHMIQVCKPTKADKSLTTNPERAVLMPKFVHVFSRDQRTQVRYLSHDPQIIAEVVAGDAAFPASLEETAHTIRCLIDQAL